MKTIYLDHAATSPMHPEVIRVMTDAMSNDFGNPSSIHSTGRAARKVLDDARGQLAQAIGAQDAEIILTSGGTEADNLAILGTAYANAPKGKHIITTQIEHHAVLHACEKLEREGFDVTYLPVDECGQVQLEAVKAALRDDTILVTIMYGNNEVGAKQPIEAIGELLKDHQAYFHTDAVQAFGIESLHVNELKVDLLSVSAHKLNGPKGIGFLYQRAGTHVAPILFGGSQEKKRRAGTENVPAVVGFAKAVEIAQREFVQKGALYHTFRQQLLDILQQHNIQFSLNGHQQETLPHVLNISFVGMDVESFLVNLDLAGVNVSSGSACTAGSLDPSHVLVAMFGKDAPQLRNSIRFSFGFGLTTDDIVEAAERTVKIVKRLAK